MNGFVLLFHEKSKHIKISGSNWNRHLKIGKNLRFCWVRLGIWWLKSYSKSKHDSQDPFGQVFYCENQWTMLHIFMARQMVNGFVCHIEDRYTSKFTDRPCMITHLGGESCLRRQDFYSRGSLLVLFAWTENVTGEVCTDLGFSMIVNYGNFNLFIIVIKFRTAHRIYQVTVTRLITNQPG
jgi:hypothetical protein